MLYIAYSLTVIYIYIYIYITYETITCPTCCHEGAIEKLPERAQILILELPCRVLCPRRSGLNHVQISQVKPVDLFDQVFVGRIWIWICNIPKLLKS